MTGTQNYRVNPTTGDLANDGEPDTPQTFAEGDFNEGRTPDASAAAYSNSTRGMPLPEATELYDIDERTNSVVEQVPANDGTLVTQGKLRMDPTALNGFDISPDGDQNAYAVLDAPNSGVASTAGLKSKPTPSLASKPAIRAPSGVAMPRWLYGDTRTPTWRPAATPSGSQGVDYGI